MFTGKQTLLVSYQITTSASYDANSSNFSLSFCTIIIFHFHNFPLLSTYIQLPKFLTAKVEETLRMSTTTRSSLPILPTILPTILLPDATQSNLSAQEGQKSDTWLSTCLLPPLPFVFTLLTKTHFTQLLSCSLLDLPLAQSACTICLHRLLAQSSGCRF